MMSAEGGRRGRRCEHDGHTGRAAERVCPERHDVLRIPNCRTRAPPDPAVASGSENARTRILRAARTEVNQGHGSAARGWRGDPQA
jgi:hypothetical protein